MRVPLLVVSLCLSAVVTSQAQGTSASPSPQSGEARGVNPADNLTKIELLPKLTVTDNDLGISVSTMTLKYDRAIRGSFGLNVELPFARFESPFGSNNGISDLNVRGRYLHKLGGGVTAIVGAEAVIPVATADTLGSGKLQVNPTIAVVFPLTKHVFLATVVKQQLSVAGDDERADIRQGLYRALVAYSSPKGWWLLGDPQLYVDYSGSGQSDLQGEVEFGKMVGPLTGVWLRAGGHVAGSWVRNDWTVSAGIRFIKF